ncbi:MAG: rod shape-determining protein RodA [Holosporales bacterium]|jgi:rod shape determining protein RodA|nr:rod shape-determining protein RodA [Holosporales bacterium]
MNKLKFKITLPPLFPLVTVVSISLFALLMLYSIGAGNFYPWCIKQFCRLLLGVTVMMVISSVNSRFWRQHAYMAYFCCLGLLLSVAVVGKISMGAQRWLNLYFFNFQPSELMRIFLVVALARYFSDINGENAKKSNLLIIPIMMTGLPVFFVLLQPDLGTATLLIFICMSILFACGVQVWKFLLTLGVVAVVSPILWSTLHQYQQERILMFLNPEMDPNGSGYHIIQSQIALGSGGFFGKGLMNGSQCQLNFLPEKQTDFVFAALGEELGFIGCGILIMLYISLLCYNLAVTLRSRDRFTQLMVFGLNSMLFFYIFINMAMVCGILPVVGIPLPFFSYGGSAMLALMFCQGLIFAADKS